MIGAAKHMNSQHQLAIAGAYAAECFARTKTLKKLLEYLPKPILTAAEAQAERDEGSRKLLAQIRRIKAKQDADGSKPTKKSRKGKRNG
jgi:hypothetical protein